MKGLLISLIIFWQAYASASDVVLKNATASVKDGKASIEYTFDSRIDPRKVSLDFINDTVQVDIPSAYIEEKKRFINIEDEKIKNLYSYQLDNKTLRLRINYKSGNNTANFTNAVKTAFDGNKLIVTIDDGRIPLKAAALPEKKVLQVVNVEDLTGESSIEADSTVVAATNEVAVPQDQNSGASEAVVDESQVTEEKVNLSEAEIPVLQKISPAQEKKSGSYLFRIVSSFVILGLFALGMFLLRKKWSKTNHKNPHTHIKVLTTHYLGPKKSLAIIHVAGESILIGVTENNINLIKSLALLDEDIPESTPTHFGNTMNEVNQKYEEGHQNTTEQDTFSISGIKDIVKSRLKTMREL